VRTSRHVSLTVIDVDHFKRVNDDHGHAAGDRALQAVAALLRQSVRRTDLVAR
jgi:diguanylate cyclase (GGDEF)-like protein